MNFVIRHFQALFHLRRAPSLQLTGRVNPWGGLLTALTYSSASLNKEDNAR